MNIADFIMIGAVLIGPLIAVQTQKWIEKSRAGFEQKLWVFKTLMATRGTTVAPLHVQALNMIELEFSMKKQCEKQVIEAWKLYLDHLCEGPHDFQAEDYQSKLNSWSEKSKDYLVDLLHKMALSLGYDFDKVQLKKGAYTPKGHADLEMEQYFIRKGVIDIIAGNKALYIDSFNKGNQKI